MKTVNDIRRQLIQKYRDGDFVTDKTGQKTVEVVAESFIANEDWIVKLPNKEYIKRELEWYKSQSLFVKDIPGETPAIWKQVADADGKINSNYGWAIWSEENHSQYMNVLMELIMNGFSRRATMIYNRPSMHTDYNQNGMSDFMCTYANGFFIRDNKLHSHYIMRSNDARFGYANDVAWAKYVQQRLLDDLNTNEHFFENELELGDLYWTATSLHVYERDFKLLDDLISTGKYEG